MKKINLICAAVFCLQIFLISQENKTAENSSAYMLGLALTRDISEYEFSKNEIDDIIKGFSDGVRNKVDYNSKLNYDKIVEMLNQKKEILTQKNKREGEEYLKKLSSEKNATVIENGIVYVKKQEGKGPSPKETDTVKVHYRGRFINGQEFDSSYKRNQPIEFNLSSVIPCWTKAVSKMKVGEKAVIGCPSDMAYGDEGIRGVISPGSTLIFDIELIDIVKKNEEQKSKATK